MKNINHIKKLKQLTGVGLTVAKQALESAGGDFNRALRQMKAKGLAQAQGKAGKPTTAGIIISYVHDDRIGVLVEISCETDFVARNDQFQSFAKNIALQVAASRPEYLNSEQLTNEQKSEFAAPSELEKFIAQACLLNQTYIKDPKLTVNDYLQSAIAQLGENIVIERFSRLERGQPTVVN